MFPPKFRHKNLFVLFITRVFPWQTVMFKRVNQHSHTLLISFFPPTRINITTPHINNWCFPSQVLLKYIVYLKKDCVICWSFIYSMMMLHLWYKTHADTISCALNPWRWSNTEFFGLGIRRNNLCDGLNPFMLWILALTMYNKSNPAIRATGHVASEPRSQSQIFKNDSQQHKTEVKTRRDN